MQTKHSALRVLLYHTNPIQSHQTSFPPKLHSNITKPPPPTSSDQITTSMMNDEQVIKSQPKVSYLLFNHCFPGKRQKKPQGMYEKDMTSYV